MPTLQRVGRNELCPCGSKQKYKKCCLATERAKRLSYVQQLTVNNQGQASQRAMLQVLVDHMRKAGVYPAYCHATEATGLIVCAETMGRLDHGALQQWLLELEGYKP